jgi:hypothetical protein
LGNDNADPAVGCLNSLTDRPDLHHDQRPDIMGLADQIARVIQREGYYGGPNLQGVAKDFSIQGLRDVIYREIAIGQGGQQVDFAFHRLGGAKQGPDAPEPALIRDRGGEFRRCYSSTHPSEYDRYVDAEEVAKLCPKHSLFPQPDELSRGALGC